MSDDKIVNIAGHKGYREWVDKTPIICGACQNNTFWLTTDGCIYCTNCKEGISDLKTVEPPDGDT